MALLDTWHDIAYNEKLDRDSLQKLWSVYFSKETAIYEELLKKRRDERKSFLKRR